MKVKLKKKRQVQDCLNADIRKCRRCPGLNNPGSTMSAPGYGNIKSPVMFVGQSLHAYNPETPDVQIPFLGPSTRYDSGNILIEAVNEVGLDYCDVFTTNAVHCHPPGNRASREWEVKECSEYLEREIVLVKPRVVVALGTGARYALAKLGLDTRYARGKIYRKHVRMVGKNMGVVWVYHPAYLLRGGNQEEIDQWKRVIGEIIHTVL